MAEIDHSRFGYDVSAALQRVGLSYRGAEASWPSLNHSMLSRAVNAKPLSAANHLVVCRALDLDPFGYLLPPKPKRTLKSVVKQAVARGAPRETQGGAP